MRWVARQERAVRIEEHKAAGVVGRNDSLEQLRPGSLDFRVHKGTGQEHGDVSPGRSALWFWHCPLRTVGPPRARALGEKFLLWRVRHLLPRNITSIHAKSRDRAGLLYHCCEGAA